MDGILWNLRPVRSSLQSCYTKLPNNEICFKVKQPHINCEQLLQAWSKDNFPTLKTFANKCMDHPKVVREACAKAERSLEDIERAFWNWFTTCKKIGGLIDLITGPRQCKAEDSVRWKAQLPEFILNIWPADVELELCDFLENRSRVLKLETTGASAFWVDVAVHESYPNLSKIALKLMTLFGSTNIIPDWLMSIPGSCWW